MPGPFRVTGTAPCEGGWVIEFEGLATGDGWQNLYPFNKHTGHRKVFDAWAEEVGLGQYTVEPNFIRVTDECDLTIVLIAWR